MFEHLWQGLRKLRFSDRVEAHKKRGDPISYIEDENIRVVHKELDANLITSLSEEHPGWHLPVIDLDYQAHLVPSRTPGHFHLYLDTPVEEEDYWKLLRVMAECGLIEYGYYGASKQRGYTAARIPSAQTRFEELMGGEDGESTG